MQIISISGIKTSSYQMWYRFDNSLTQKNFYVGLKKVKPTDKIEYICDSCNLHNCTILRTFNDRVMKEYNTFSYICNKCVRNRVHFTKEEKISILKDIKDKELKTKTKNKTRPSDILSREGSLGFIGKDQSKNSEIRIKMNQTKLKNNSNTKKGTEAYSKRAKTYNSFTVDKLNTIKTKQLITKTKNGTDGKSKFENGEIFGFINMGESERLVLSKKIDLILSEKDKNGVSKYTHNAQKRVKLMQEKGLIIKDEEKSDYELYKQKVWFWTNTNNLVQLKNYDLRGRADLKENAHHLDHKISIFYGFKNNIPSYIIGSIHNLEIIPFSVNCHKQHKCSTTIDYLILKINE